MRKKVVFVFMFLLLFTGFVNECFAVKITGWLRQRHYHQNNWNLDGTIGGSDKATNYEGLYTFKLSAKLGDDITVFIGPSAFIHMGTKVRDLGLGSCSIQFKNFFKLPVTFEAGMWRQKLHEGFFFGLLRTYGVRAEIEFSKNVTLQTLWAIENEWQTWFANKGGIRDETYQAAVLNFKPKFGLVQVGFYNFIFSFEDSAFTMPYFYADGSFDGFSYVTEWGIQSGKRTVGVDQKSYGGYVEGKYTLKDTTLKPYFGVRYYLLSGDDPDTPEFEGYNKLYRQGNIFMPFGEIATRLRVPNETNMRIINLKAGLKFSKATKLDVQLYLNTRDKVAAGVDKAYGTEFEVALTHMYTRSCSMEVKYSYFNPVE